jgi:hypothetical protein
MRWLVCCCSGVPYANGSYSNYYADDPIWNTIPVRQRWAFASSYNSVPHAWQGDGSENVYVPVDGTPHRYRAIGNALLGRRHLSEVCFPSQKVHMHEEFDFEQTRYPFFAYDHARPEKLMFDGSINSRPSGEAHTSVSPEDFGQVQPDFVPEWTQVYVPLDAFPAPVDGLGSQEELNMRYCWTLYGLQGIGFTS